MQVKLLLSTFYLNGGLSETRLNGCQIFGRFGRIRTEFRFSAHP